MARQDVLGKLMSVASKVGKSFGATPTVVLGEGNTTISYHHFPTTGRVTRLTVPASIASPAGAGEDHWYNLESAMVCALTDVC